MSLRRRVIFAGAIASLLYGALVLVVAFAAGGTHPFQAVPAFLLGLATAFIAGAMVFGFVPHLAENFMKNSINLLDFLNTLSFSVALVSILIGVCASLLLIFGVAQAMKPLLVSITLFLGSFAILCTLRFFHYNRENE